MKQLLLLCLLAFTPVALANADLKIAVVDLAKAFDQYYKTKDAQARIQQKQDAFKKEYTDMATEYQQMGEEAQKLFDSSKDPTLSVDARNDKGKALEQKKQELTNMERKMEEMKVERGRELQDEIVRRHGEIVTEISKIITEYSGPLGFDMVIDKSSTSTASGVPIVLYNSAKLIDITTDVITRLNATAPPPSGTAPAAAPTH